MKTYNSNWKWVGEPLKASWAALATLLLTTLGGSLALGQALQNSPVGSWDCLISGAGQQGLAVFTFYDDGTFAGYELMTPKVSNLEAENGERYNGSGIGRNPGKGGITTSTNLVGFGDFTGAWSYDVKGRVIGSFALNTVAHESDPETQPTSVSFTAKVVPDKRLTLVGSSASGKLTYSGIPIMPFTDLSGFWYGAKAETNQVFLEFFTLTPTERIPGVPNLYTVEGQAAAYDVSDGFCLVSTQKKIGFGVSEFVGTNGVHRTTFGTVSVPRTGPSAKTKGIRSPNTPVSFNAFWQAPFEVSE